MQITHRLFDEGAKVTPDAPPDRTGFRPTLDEALAAFYTVVAFCAGNFAPPRTYDQRPGHLPADAKSSDAYKRWHRSARREGLPGVWVRGKLLVATSEAWETPLQPRRSRSERKPMADDDAQLDAALGIRAVRRPS